MMLLDTNVVSELRKLASGRADVRFAAWADLLEAESAYLSAITVQELETGVLLAERRDPRQGVRLRRWLDEQVIPAFEGRILPVDTAVALRAAFLGVPDPRPLQDGLIAATAYIHRLTLVTRNVSDFAGTEVKVINPWDEG